jgi:hypothetical protein
LPPPALASAPLGAHGAFAALGVAAAVLVFVLEARRRGTLDDRLAWTVIRVLRRLGKV